MRRSGCRREEIEIRLALYAKSLPNLDLEERVIGMRMTPREVLLLLILLHFIECTIILMLLLEIGPVGAIFVVVPGVVVFAFFIVVALVLVISVVSSRCDGSDERGAQYERTQN